MNLKWSLCDKSHFLELILIALNGYLNALNGYNLAVSVETEALNALLFINRIKKIMQSVFADLYLKMK